MIDILAPLLPEYTLFIPEDPIALIGWAVWLCLIVYVVLRVRDNEQKINRSILPWLALLSSLVLILTPFLGMLPVSQDSGFPSLHLTQHLMFFAAVPWMVAGGLLGILPGTLLAGISGLLLAYLDTHNIFTPLLFMSYAVIFGWFVRQPYRTLGFRYLRFPLLAAAASLFAVLPLIIIGLILSTSGLLSIRIAASLTLVSSELLSFGGMVLIGGVICVVVRAFSQKAWGAQEPFIPAPGETSLKFRFIVKTTPILMTLLIGMVAGVWVVGENISRRTLVDQLTRAAGVVADGLPIFIQTGERLILDLAEDEAFLAASPEAAETLLDQKVAGHPYFEFMALMDAHANPTIIFPQMSTIVPMPTPKENFAINEVFQGVSVRFISVPPEPESQAHKMSYFASVLDPTGQVTRVLWGRVDLTKNPLTKPMMSILEELEENRGEVQVFDAEGTLIFHTDPDRVIQTYSGTIYNTPTYFETPSPGGAAKLQFYLPVAEKGWLVVTSLPMEALQAMAWQTTFPLLLFGLSTMVIVLIIALTGLSPITSALQKMRKAVEEVSAGNFNGHLPGDDVPGEMRKLIVTFNKMVDSLRDRINNHADLSRVSGRLIRQRTLSDSLEVIMKAALGKGVSSVRIILSSEGVEEIPMQSPHRYGLGKHARLFASLDDEILSRSRSEGPLIWRDFQFGKTFSLAKGMPYPASMIAMPMKYEDTWLGTLWVTYQDQRLPDAKDVDFFKALSERAAQEIVTVKILETANSSRHQLESVLDVLPDALLIVDGDSSVIYHNKAAQTISGMDNRVLLGEQLSTLFDTESQVKFLGYGQEAQGTKEVRFEDGKIYQIIVSPIEVGNHGKGQVIIFKDITHLKLEESIKTEVVTTVSHELRSPLSLIHGYAKILRLTGNLDEQQDMTMLKIIDVIEEMKNLVQNLLDIGRLETGVNLEIQQITLADFTQKVLESMAAQARQKNIQVLLSVPDHPVIFEADVTLMTQALKNLLENAIKFTNMGGEVTLNVDLEGDKVLFAVQDNGIGIAPLDQRRLFEKFQRVNPMMSQKQNGSGLGLAIVKSIADRHGGEVWLESQLGQGSTFFLQIPKHHAGEMKGV